MEDLNALFNAPVPAQDTHLLDGYSPRAKKSHVLWYCLVMLVTTLLWSYTWNPLLNYLHIWTDPPKGVTGYDIVTPVTLVYLAVCMILAVIAGAAACARQFRPVFTNAVLVLAASAVAFIVTMELSTGKPWASLFSFLS